MDRDGKGREMDGRVTTTMLDERTAVVRVSGPSDPATLELLADELDRQARQRNRAVVELDGLAIVDVKAVQAFLGTLPALGPDAVSFACRRLSCRRLIRHLAGDDVGIHARVADALAHPFGPSVPTATAG